MRREIRGDNVLLRRPSPPPLVFSPERGKWRGRRPRKNTGLPKKLLLALTRHNGKRWNSRWRRPRWSQVQNFGFGQNKSHHSVLQKKDPSYCACVVSLSWAISCVLPHEEFCSGFCTWNTTSFWTSNAPKCTSNTAGRMSTARWATSGRLPTEATEGGWNPIVAPKSTNNGQTERRWLTDVAGRGRVGYYSTL